MNLIKTKVITTENDAWWQDTGSLTAGMSPRPVLVITQAGQSAEEETQLQKMLAACKLSPEQYNIVRLKDGEAAPWHKLRDTLDPMVVFMTGIEPSQLGISAMFQLNVPNSFDRRRWLPTITLTSLAVRDDVKKQLWNSGMKPIFIDKIYGEIQNPASPQ